MTVEGAQAALWAAQKSALVGVDGDVNRHSPEDQNGYKVPQEVMTPEVAARRLCTLSDKDFQLPR